MKGMEIRKELANLADAIPQEGNLIAPAGGATLTLAESFAAMAETIQST